MTVSVIKRVPVTCLVCGSSAIEYHYSTGQIEVVCFGHCGNKWSK